MSDVPLSPVLQLRLVVEADDYEAAVVFYRDALGLAEEEVFEEVGDARITLLEAGRATLEIVNSAQRAIIDGVETDGATSPRIRLAFEVTDTEVVTNRLVEAGANLVASPRETPWRSLNSRLDAPAGLQITLFEEPPSAPISPG